jgi:hypothetical protein
MIANAYQALDPQMLKTIVSGEVSVIRNSIKQNLPMWCQFLQKNLHYFANLWRWCKFGAKDNIPKAASDSETILVVHEVVLEVVFLQLSPV